MLPTPPLSTLIELPTPQFYRFSEKRSLGLIETNYSAPPEASGLPGISSQATSTSLDEWLTLVSLERAAKTALLAWEHEEYLDKFFHDQSNRVLRKQNIHTHEKVVDRPGNDYDQPLCPHWTGGWLCISTPDRPDQWIPVGCGKRWCSVCGPKKNYKTQMSFTEGCHILWPQEKCIRVKLATFTLRARPTKLVTDAFGIQHRVPLMSWEQWTKWHHIDPTAPDMYPPDDWHDLSNAKYVRNMAKRPLTPHERVILRARQTPQQWRKYWSGLLQMWSDRWRNKWHCPFEYIGSVEFTEQGTPHFHAAYVRPEGVTQQELEQWAWEVWEEITGDDDLEPGVCVTMGKKLMVRSRQDPSITELVEPSVDKAVAYAVYYLQKDWNKSAPQMGYDNDPQDWNHGIRRYSRSKDWPVAIGLDINACHTIDKETGERVVYDVAQRRRDYGRYHRITEKYQKIDQLKDLSLEEWIKFLDPVVNWYRCWVYNYDLDRSFDTDFQNPGEEWDLEGLEWDPKPEITRRVWLIQGKIYPVRQ